MPKSRRAADPLPPGVQPELVGHTPAVSNAWINDLMQSLDLGDQATTSVDVDITGHASPRWRQPAGGTPEFLNRGLSAERAGAVDAQFRALFGEGLLEHGFATEFEQSCDWVDHDLCDPDAPTRLTTTAEGSDETLDEAGGDPESDDPALRRVDLDADVTWHVSGALPMPGTDEVRLPEHCHPQMTRDWAVRANLTGGAGHLGVGGLYALMELRNERTGQVTSAHFAGGGGGVGLQTPGASGFNSWTRFTTYEPVDFEDFDGTVARMTTAGGGLLLVSWSSTTLTLPTLCDDGIDLGGWSFLSGAFGADASTNLGAFWLDGQLPQPQCHEERLEEWPAVRSMPYNYDVPNRRQHTVHFDTQSAEVSVAEGDDLQGFVGDLMDVYEWPG